MGAPRRKNLMASRRRAEDEGEEEEGSVAAGVEDESLSEGSVPSDADDDADAEGSEVSDQGVPRKNIAKRRASPETHTKVVNGKVENIATSVQDSTFTSVTTDTEAMLNGLKISDAVVAAEEIDFDNMSSQVAETGLPDTTTYIADGAEQPQTLIERRRREHEEYKKKRDADPAFVPNRGGFFMHDHRSAAPGQNGFRPFGSRRGGRGGRGGFGPQFTPALQGQNSSAPADAPWAHDLHETVVQPEPAKTDSAAWQSPGSQGQQARSGSINLHNPPPNRSFSRTVKVGTVQIRVLIAGMDEPIIFSAVSFNQHTRLPHHRPPLRRDKPVRVSIPDSPPRHIFPAMDRSFIFIPRALRPNQQGFGRGRGRSSFGAYSGYPSGRTSVYGGSNYSPSVAMSRRSSLAREYTREGLVSPAGSAVSRNRSGFADAGKPVVRLPPAGDHGPPLFRTPSYSNSPTPIVHLPQSYPPPQMPLSSEHRPSTLTMHQPRPQKTVSLAELESPATMNFQPPLQRQQQPFHQQVPPQMNGQMYSHEPNIYQHAHHSSHPSQQGTPLSQIPERAIHAQPFQPFPYQQQQAFYPHQYPPPVFYYPPQAPAMAPSVTAPAFVPGHQYPYVVPAAPPVVPSEPAAQSGTVAHESNGMVYYYDSSQLAGNTEAPAIYPPVAYAPPNGYMVPQPAVYYPTQ